MIMRSTPSARAVGASFKVVGVSPMILINVLDPNKHKKNLPEKTVQVNDGVAVVEEKDILLDKLTVKAEETPLAARYGLHRSI